MSQRRRLTAVLLLAGLTLTGCRATETPPPAEPTGVALDGADATDGNGIWLRSGADSIDIITRAMDDAGPVHLTARLQEVVRDAPDDPGRPGRTITIDFRGTESSHLATVTAGDVSFEVAANRAETRVRGNAAFARSTPGRTADEVFCTVGRDEALEEWSPLMDPAALVTSLSAPVSVLAHPPVGDADTIDVSGGEEGSVVSTLIVERYGPPLPRSYVGADQSGSAAVTFENWGDPVNVDAAMAGMTCPAD